MTCTRTKDLTKALLMAFGLGVLSVGGVGRDEFLREHATGRTGEVSDGRLPGGGVTTNGMAVTWTPADNLAGTLIEGHPSRGMQRAKAGGTVTALLPRVRLRDLLAGAYADDGEPA